MSHLRTFVLTVSVHLTYVGYYNFASAVVAVYSSHMTVSSSASWSTFSLPSNFVSVHVSTMWVVVCRWPQSQEGDWGNVWEQLAVWQPCELLYTCYLLLTYKVWVFFAIFHLLCVTAGLENMQQSSMLMKDHCLQIYDQTLRLSNSVWYGLPVGYLNSFPSDGGLWIRSATHGDVFIRSTECIVTVKIS